MTMSPHVALVLLRAGTALMMIVHGVARAWLGIVDDFGVVLNTWGFPAGFALAWTITLVEIIGGALLAAGMFILPISAWFTFQLLMGIYLIHGRVGWFVVGGDVNVSVSRERVQYLNAHGKLITERMATTIPKVRPIGCIFPILKAA